MRVSSLSDDRIISLLSRYFVSVWISRDNYQLGKVNPQDQKLLTRIDADRHRKNLEGGTVAVYIVTADGEALATMKVHSAWDPDILAPFLRKIIAEQKLTARPASAVSPSPSVLPPAPGVRRFTVCAGYEDRRLKRGTSRDQVDLTQKEWVAFVAPAKAAQGTTWNVARPVAEKLLRYAYPPLPHWDARLSTVRNLSLSATVLQVSQGEALVKLQGRLELIYPDKGKPDDGRLTASLVGYVRCDINRGTLTSLHLVSQEGRYVWYWQGKPQPQATLLAVQLQP